MKLSKSIYQPPKRNYSKRDISEYQPKSGSKLAFEYASRRAQGGKYITIINVYTGEK